MTIKGQGIHPLLMILKGQGHQVTDMRTKGQVSIDQGRLHYNGSGEGHLLTNDHIPPQIPGQGHRHMSRQRGQDRLTPDELTCAHNPQHIIGQIRYRVLYQTKPPKSL